MKPNDSIKMFESCDIPHEALEGYKTRLLPEIEKILHAQTQRYQSVYASVYAPFDEDMIALVKKVAVEKEALNPTMLVVIGIGGSHLGAAAVHEALNGTLYNELNPVCRLYFVDSVDTQRVSIVVRLMEQELKQGNNVLLNVISKSGKTTETIANFYVFHAVLQKYAPDKMQDLIVVTSDDGSELCSFAQNYGYTFLPIPKQVGGRFSVFSAVGLFPLAFIGVDIDQLCAGARDGFIESTRSDSLSNHALRTAIFLHYHYTHGMLIYNLFIFWQDGQKIGDWYRQLLAESIGKEYDKEGKQVFVGITPIVSVGSTDLHSVTQLYLAGPYNTSTTFITIQKEDEKIVVPDLDGPITTTIIGKTLENILSAIAQGTMRAYQQAKRPYTHLVLPKKNSYFIGMLLQSKMIEILYLGYLCNVNPFDQPHVELYKTQTQRLLENE